MPTANANGIQLFYELGETDGPPLVLVHGSWESHADWDPVVPALSETYQVLTYDRRGHSQSERPPGGDSIHDDIADLAALIESLGLAPAWVVGNSFGASISLRLALDRPDLVRGLVVHEPPLLALLADDPEAAPMLEDVQSRVGSVLERIESGDHEGAARQFIETVAIGPGAWDEIPHENRQTLIENAPTFVDESRDPDQFTFDLQSAGAFSKPVLLTTGDKSPPMFSPVVSRVAKAFPNTETHRFPEAGHIPHVTHPDAFVGVVRDFVDRRSL